MATVLLSSPLSSCEDCLLGVCVPAVFLLLLLLLSSARTLIIIVATHAVKAAPVTNETKENDLEVILFGTAKYNPVAYDDAICNPKRR